MINYILLNNKLVKEADINKINTEFKVSFKKGKYQAMYLKLFNNDSETFNNQDIFNIFVEEFTNVFFSNTYDILHNIYKGGLILLINYNHSDENFIRERVDIYFKVIKKLSTKFNGVNFILSLGEITSEVNQLYYTIYSSINNLKYRINYGLNTIIDTSLIKENMIKGKNILSNKDIWKLKNIIESYNRREFACFSDEVLFKINNEYNEDVICFFETLECINNTILEMYKYMNIAESVIEELSNKYDNIINFEIDRKVLINKYKLFVLKQLEEIFNGTNKKELTVVTKAKKYISDNYQSQITLEAVAEAVEITPAYLSTMFKKELGINFCDYIIELRIELAKNILKSTNMSIAEVTEKVGYTDCRYFSKLFDKVVGIKPSKYRKLYNKG